MGDSLGLTAKRGFIATFVPSLLRLSTSAGLGRPIKFMGRISSPNLGHLGLQFFGDFDWCDPYNYVYCGYASSRIDYLTIPMPPSRSITNFSENLMSQWKVNLSNLKWNSSINSLKAIGSNKHFPITEEDHNSRENKTMYTHNFAWSTFKHHTYNKTILASRNMVKIHGYSSWPWSEFKQSSTEM